MDFQHIVNATWDFFREGFNQVNALEGLIIALIAAVFGFGAIASSAAGVAKVLFFVFLALAALSLIFRRRVPV